MKQLKQLLTAIFVSLGVALGLKFLCDMPPLVASALFVLFVMLSAVWIYIESKFIKVFLTLVILFMVGSASGWQIIHSKAPVTYQSMPLIKRLLDVDFASRFNTGNADGKVMLYEYQNNQDKEAAKLMAMLLNSNSPDRLDNAIRIMEDQKKNRDKVYDAFDNRLSSYRKPLFGGQKNHSSQVSGPVAPEPVKIYQPGTYTFSLKAGEKTDHWIMFPVGILLRLSLSSQDYGYNILFADGDLIQGGENVVLPNKARTKFKLIAITDQPEIAMVVQDKRIAQK